jgi:hypothetical protein
MSVSSVFLLGPVSVNGVTPLVSADLRSQRRHRRAEKSQEPRASPSEGRRLLQ